MAIQFEGCNYFRQRLVLSTLSSRPVRITKIREDSEEPGVKGKFWFHQFLVDIHQPTADILYLRSHTLTPSLGTLVQLFGI